MSDIPPDLLTSTPGRLTEDQVDPGMMGGPQWGIFGQNGSPVIVADSVYDIDYQRDYRISDYPQEQGAFLSYNKVKVPFDAEVGFLTSQTRHQVLTTMEGITASLNLVAVITPEVQYPSANIIGYRLRRASREGVTLVLIIVKVKEVRIVGTGTVSNGQIGGSNTQSTNAASPTQSGQTQAQIPAQPSTAATTTTTTPAAPSIDYDFQQRIGAIPNAPVNPNLPALPEAQYPPFVIPVPPP